MFPGHQPRETISRKSRKYGYLSKPTIPRRCPDNRYPRTEGHSRMSYSSNYTLFLDYLTIISLPSSSRLYYMGKRKDVDHRQQCKFSTNLKIYIVHILLSASCILFSSSSNYTRTLSKCLHHMFQPLRIRSIARGNVSGLPYSRSSR